jgi:hypothetical protein
MSALSPEVAMLEIEKWLDHKKVSANKRESNEEAIKTLAEEFSSGNMILKDSFELQYKLKAPIQSERATSELIFKPRLTIGSVYNHLQGVKPTDADGRLFAYAAALTGNPKDLIKALEIDDWNIVQAVVVFFL